MAKPDEAGSDAERTLHPGYARVVMALVQERDPSALRLFDADDLHYLDPAEGAPRCPLSRWHRLMDQAEHALGLADIVPDLAVRLQPWHVGLMGFTAMTSRNLEEVGRVLRRYHHLLNDVFVVDRQSEGGHFALRLRATSGDASPRLARLSLATWAQRTRWLTGRDDLRFDVSFQGPSPGRTDDYRRLFGGQVRFEAEANCLRGDTGCLSWPLVSSDAASHGLLQRQAAQQLAQLSRREERFLDHLQALIHANLGTGKANLEDLAQAMRMPTRTLQRRLEGEGLHLRLLIDQARRARAEKWLRETDMALVDIASALGFADHASFNRAFKRWTGCSPGAFRRAQIDWDRRAA